jgi:hypothetical protein
VLGLGSLSSPRERRVLSVLVGYGRLPLEFSSQGAMLQAPEVRLGASKVEPSVPERALGGDSGSVGERSFVLESPLHACGVGVGFVTGG